MNLVFCAVIFAVLSKKVLSICSVIKEIYYDLQDLFYKEFLISTAKVSQVKTGEWMRTDVVLIQNRNSQVTMSSWPFYYNIYI